jgi:hypothetical protein
MIVASPSPHESPGFRHILATHIKETTDTGASLVHHLCTLVPDVDTICHISPVVGAGTRNDRNPWYHRIVQRYQEFLCVGDTGFEPVTPAVSRQFRPFLPISGKPLHRNDYHPESPTALGVTSSCVSHGVQGFSHLLTCGLCQIRVRSGCCVLPSAMSCDPCVRR